MMRNFITWVKGVLQMFFQRETIKRAVGAEVAISAGMQDAITLWQKMFCNEPPWLDKNTETLGLAAAVASEIARLVSLWNFTAKSAAVADGRHFCRKAMLLCFLN